MLGQHAAPVKRKRGKTGDVFGRFARENGLSMRVVPRIILIIRPGMQETVFRDFSVCGSLHGNAEEISEHAKRKA